MSTQGLDVLDIARELVRTPSPNPPGDERATAELVRVLLPELHLPEPEPSPATSRGPTC